MGDVMTFSTFLVASVGRCTTSAPSGSGSTISDGSTTATGSRLIGRNLHRGVGRTVGVGAAPRGHWLVLGLVLGLVLADLVRFGRGGLSGHEHCDDRTDPGEKAECWQIEHKRGNAEPQADNARGQTEDRPPISHRRTIGAC